MNNAYTETRKPAIATWMIVTASLGGLLVLGLILLFTLVGSFNSYTRLEVKAVAVQRDNTNVLDNTRKAIREASAVSDKEVEALVSIITGNSKERGKNSSGEGTMISVGVVHEAVPAITDIKTLNKLMNIVVAGRKDWQNAQTRLIEVKREADEAINTFPGNFVLGMFGKKPIEIVVVISTETEGNFKTGKDDSEWVEKPTKK